MSAIVHFQSFAGQGNQRFCLYDRSAQEYNHLSNHSISGLRPCPPCPQLAPPIPSILPPSAQRGALASTAPPPVDDRGQAFPGACLLSVLSPSH